MTDEAFARAARTYGDTIYRVAYHALSSPHDAEDVMQTVLLRLYEHMEEWRETAAPEDPARAEVLEAVMALEPKYRLAVYLYYYEGLSVAETAAAMKANVSTVQTWLLRARARLRKELSEEKKEESVYVRPEIIP